MSNVRTWLAEKSAEEREQCLGETPRLLLESDQIQKFCRLLRDFDFIEAKINHPQLGLQALINDYELINDLRFLNDPDYNFEKIKVLKLIQGTLKLSTHILAEDKTQLATQLWGRLKDFKIIGTDIRALLEQVEQSQTIWLRLLSSSLIAPNGKLLRVLTGHRACVNTVIVSPDGRRIISGADDGILKVWDLETGKELFNLVSDSAVTTVVTTPDSRIISVSKFGIVKVWDLEIGKELFALGERDDIVKVIAITPDGKRVISTAKSRIGEISFFNKKYSEITQKMRDRITDWNLETVILFLKKIIRQNKVTVWDLNCNSNTITGERTFKSSFPVTSIAVTVTQDRTHMILGSFAETPEDGSRGTIIVQNLETGKNFTLNLPFQYRLQRGRRFSFLAFPNSSNITNDDDIITAVATIIDDMRVISGSTNGTLKIWNLETREEQSTLTGHSEEVTAVAITPNGKLAISGSKDKTLKAWNLETGEQSTFIGHSEEVTAVATTPNGKLIISSSKDKTIKIWSLESEYQQFNTHQYNQQVNPSSPNKNVFIRWLNIFYNFLKCIVNSIFRFPLYIIQNIIFLILSPLLFLLFLLQLFITICKLLLNQITSSIKNLIGCEATDSFTVTEAKTSGSRSHNGLVNAITITPDGQRAISTSDDKTLKVWDLETREEIFILTDGSNLVNTIVTDTNSKQLLFSSSDKTFKVWNLEVTNKILTFRSDSQKIYDFLRLCVSIFWIICGIFIFHKINDFRIFNFIWLFLISVSFKFINIKELEYTNTIVVTPDGQRVVSGSRDKTLKVWNLKTRRQLFTLKGHSEEVTAVAVTPDNKYLISGSRDKTLKVWNLQTRRQLFTLGNHGSSVNTVCVSPNTNQVISGSLDGTIKIWNLVGDLETREEIFTIQGHSDSVNSVVVTPDGKYLISASSDSTLKVWSLESREVITSFTGDSALYCCAVAPDGMTIVTGEASGQVHFLHLEGIEA